MCCTRRQAHAHGRLLRPEDDLDRLRGPYSPHDGPLDPPAHAELRYGAAAPLLCLVAVLVGALDGHAVELQHADPLEGRSYPHSDADFNNLEQPEKARARVAAPHAQDRARRHGLLGLPGPRVGAESCGINSHGLSVRSASPRSRQPREHGPLARASDAPVQADDAEADDARRLRARDRVHRRGPCGSRQFASSAVAHPRPQGRRRVAVGPRRESQALRLEPSHEPDSHCGDEASRRLAAASLRLQASRRRRFERRRCRRCCAGEVGVAQGRQAQAAPTFSAEFESTVPVSSKGSRTAADGTEEEVEQLSTPPADPVVEQGRGPSPSPGAFLSPRRRTHS